MSATFLRNESPFPYYYFRSYTFIKSIPIFINHSFKMYPNFFFDQTKEDVVTQHHFPVSEMLNMVAEEELTSLVDVNQRHSQLCDMNPLASAVGSSPATNKYYNQHNIKPYLVKVQDLENHDYTPYTLPEFDESMNLNSKSRTTYPELLSCYRSKFKRLVDCSKDEAAPESDGKLSTVEIIELAAQKFIKFSTQKVNGFTMFTHPYGSSPFSSLSIDDTREVELIFQLLTAAEKVGQKQFDLAIKFLIRCGWVACEGGTAVERLGYYLCKALCTRIGKETGMPVSMKLGKLGVANKNPMALGTNPTFWACHQALPFNQVLQFTSIQAIIDQVGKSRKVHLIDIHIRSGVQWTTMMQELAEKKSRIKLLKLTAFATPLDVQKVGETGKRLESFAITLSLPFVFKVLVLSDITEVQKEQFEVQDDEAVAIYCHMILRAIISKPQSLENLMRTIKTINPSIIVVSEVEANHNSTSFVSRFTEALFFYGAIFDCLEACMSRDNIHRAVVEGVHLADGMQNIVASEGDERMSRSVNMKTWRSFFSRFGLVETELSDSCLYQANLVLQQFSCASSCTLENNGKSLLVRWKGTPLHSLSTWKFIQK